MKKFLTLGLVLFGFSVLSADAMTSGKTYDEALSWCESKGMSLATKAQLKQWGGSDGCFWALEGEAIRPSSGSDGCHSLKNYKYSVRCY